MKQTYLTHVTRHAQRAIAACGGPDKVFRLCLHESNPLIVREVAGRLGFPLERVPTISATVGTLAIVSGFTLLERAMADHSALRAADNRVAMSLIGESCGAVRAGNAILSTSGPGNAGGGVLMVLIGEAGGAIRAGYLMMSPSNPRELTGKC